MRRPPLMAPAQEPMPVMPAAPVMAPKASDDMTGSVGFGTGVVAGTSLVATNGVVAMKYWMSDVMAIVPRLTLTMSKTKVPAADAGPTAWQFNPEVLASFVLLKGASTRLSAGAGIGINLSKNLTPAPTRPSHQHPHRTRRGTLLRALVLDGNRDARSVHLVHQDGGRLHFGLSVNTLAYMARSSSTRLVVFQRNAQGRVGQKPTRPFGFAWRTTCQ